MESFKFGHFCTCNVLTHSDLCSEYQLKRACPGQVRRPTIVSADYCEIHSFDAIAINQGVPTFNISNALDQSLISATMLMDKKKYQTRPSPTLNEDIALH